MRRISYDGLPKMIKSFKNAILGIYASIRSERNMRVHLSFAFYILLACAVTGVSRAELLVVVLCIAAVITAELMNTALEKLCDRVCPDRSREIALVKDMAAGAVFIFSVASAIAGGVIFFNAEKVNGALDFARNYPVFAALIVASIPAAAYLTFRKYKV